MKAIVNGRAHTLVASIKNAMAKPKHTAPTINPIIIAIPFTHEWLQQCFSPATHPTNMVKKQMICFTCAKILNTANAKKCHSGFLTKDFRVQKRIAEWMPSVKATSRTVPHNSSSTYRRLNFSLSNALLRIIQNTPSLNEADGKLFLLIQCR